MKKINKIYCTILVLLLIVVSCKKDIKTYFDDDSPKYLDLAKSYHSIKADFTPLKYQKLMSIDKSALKSTGEIPIFWKLAPLWEKAYELDAQN